VAFDDGNWKSSDDRMTLASDFILINNWGEWEADPTRGRGGVYSAADDRMTGYHGSDTLRRDE